MQNDIETFDKLWDFSDPAGTEAKFRELLPEAKEYFGLAYEELSADTWLVENEPDRIERLKKLGEVE